MLGSVGSHNMKASSLFSCMTVVFLTVVCALGQTFSSSITGLVADPSGAAVVGAQVHLKNMATNDIHDEASQANGSYQFNNLNPGTYEITVASAGFKTSFNRI
jgi:hypothetical protein